MGRQRAILSRANEHRVVISTVLWNRSSSFDVSIEYKKKDEPFCEQKAPSLSILPGDRSPGGFRRHFSSFTDYLTIIVMLLLLLLLLSLLLNVSCALLSDPFARCVRHITLHQCCNLANGPADHNLDAKMLVAAWEDGTLPCGRTALRGACPHPYNFQ
jgi:hypothetical protein